MDPDDLPIISVQYLPLVECVKRCSECYLVLSPSAFEPVEWKRTDGLHYCRTCVTTHREQGVPMRCNYCGMWKSPPAFRKAWRHGVHRITRICEQCCVEHGNVLQSSSESGRFEPLEDPTTRERKIVSNLLLSRAMYVSGIVRGFHVRWCSRCQQHYPRTYFTDRMWAQSRARRRCSKCQRFQWGKWRCTSCKNTKPKELFRLTSSRHCCEECWQRKQDARSQRRSSCSVPRPEPYVLDWQSDITANDMCIAW